jgi:hypothetical protein
MFWNKTPAQREPDPLRRVEYLSRGNEPPQTIHVFLVGHDVITVIADEVEIEPYFVVFHLAEKTSPPITREVARFSNEGFQGWIKATRHDNRQDQR